MFKFLKDEKEDVSNAEAAKDASDLEHAALAVFPSEFHHQIASEVPHPQLPQPLLSNSNILVGKESNKLISVAELLRSRFTRDEENVKKILNSSSDLISGVYEGGFKIWECTFDLINYLRNHEELFKIVDQTQILDLGCGSGLLGLFALSCSANQVHFQDFNAEVINFLTIPNVILNFGEEGLSRSKFFSGDWASFDILIQTQDPQRKYDYILSSETIYNIKSLPKFYKFAVNHLNPSGKLFLAAKTCYFGVGGGTIAVKNLIEKDGRLECQVLDVIRDGVQREILCITFNSKKI